MISDYERRKQENIQKNKDLLAQLGIDKPLLEPREASVKKPSADKKRRISEIVSNEDTSVKKMKRDQPVDSTPEGGLRRSSRNAGKKIDYTKEIEKPSLVLVAYSSGVKSSNDGPQGRDDGKRTHDPKTYGSIPGIEVGTWWHKREGCSADSIHAPWVAGISGGKDGAHSVVLSGGYDDDVDFGYAFTYTGAGGRDLKGTKDAPKNLRTGPQSFDQSFDTSYNKMLKRSCETKNPVRVVRGYRLKSQYAPSEGFRYDGLYRVERAWMDKGNNKEGYLVCKYAFKRIEGQPPLPVLADYDADAKADDMKSEDDIKGEDIKIEGLKNDTGPKDDVKNENGDIEVKTKYEEDVKAEAED